MAAKLTVLFSKSLCFHLGGCSVSKLVGDIKMDAHLADWSSDFDKDFDGLLCSSYTHLDNTMVANRITTITTGFSTNSSLNHLTCFAAEDWCLSKESCSACNSSF